MFTIKICTISGENENKISEKEEIFKAIMASQVVMNFPYQSSVRQLGSKL